jgi:hypothetical protein
MSGPVQRLVWDVVLSCEIVASCTCDRLLDPSQHYVNMSSRCTRECFHDGGANDLNDVAFVIGTNTVQVKTLGHWLRHRQDVTCHTSTLQWHLGGGQCSQLQADYHCAAGYKCSRAPKRAATKRRRMVSFGCQVVTAPAGQGGGFDSSVLLNIGEQLRDENRYDRC